jgi:hypothetical protein
MSANEQQEGVPADLLKQASQMPKGVKLEEFNPFENIPTLIVGNDFTEGMTVAGYFDASEWVASAKFAKYSKTKNEEGTPTRLRHVLRIGSPTGNRLGIWTTGELGKAFEKLVPGDLISITYKGKGENAKGDEQHFFEMKRPVPVSQ